MSNWSVAMLEAARDVAQKVPIPEDGNPLPHPDALCGAVLAFAVTEAHSSGALTENTKLCVRQVAERWPMLLWGTEHNKAWRGLIAEEAAA